MVKVARNKKEREEGISNKHFLSQDRGMLFIFEKPDYYAFTMEGVNFPLDFIWIKENEIIEITENVIPTRDRSPEPIKPHRKIDKTLEVNAGFVKRYNIKVGDKIKLQNDFTDLIKFLRYFFERLKNFFS